MLALANPRGGSWGALAALSLAHTVVDCYGGFLAPILVLVLAPKLGFGEGLAAWILGLNVGVLSLGQLAFGYLADRLGGRRMVLFAPAVIGLAAGSFLAVSQLAVLIPLVAINAAAIAAFHPEGAALAGTLGRRDRSLPTAIFMAAGPVGLTLGPLLITWAARRPTSTWWLPVLGLMASGLLVALLPRGERSRPRRGPERQALRLPPAPLRGRLVSLMGISSLRYFINIGLHFGIPVLLAERLGRGGALSASGLWLSLFLGSGAVGGIVGSMLSRGRSPRWTNAASFTLGGGLLFTLPNLEGLPAACALIAIGLSLGWTSPSVVALGQRLLPGATAVASALILGVSWFLGGPVAPVLFETVHRLGGSTAAVDLLGVASLLAGALALGLPARGLPGSPSSSEPSPSPAPDSVPDPARDPLVGESR